MVWEVVMLTELLILGVTIAELDTVLEELSEPVIEGEEEEDIVTVFDPDIEDVVEIELVIEVE